MSGRGLRGKRWHSTTDTKVLVNDAGWQDVLFYKCCYRFAALRSIYNTDDENVEIALHLIFSIVVVS
jgi:hypothetical protein